MNYNIKRETWAMYVSQSKILDCSESLWLHKFKFQSHYLRSQMWNTGSQLID